MMRFGRFAVAFVLAVTLCATSASAVSIARALRMPLPDVNLNSIALADAIDYVRDVSNTNIVVNWRALEAAGVDKDVAVTVRLRGVLDGILEEAGGTTQLAYTHDEDVLEITTKELADKKLITRIYSVED